jgi:Flp pilus assembly protein TadG
MAQWFGQDQAASATAVHPGLRMRPRPMIRARRDGASGQTLVEFALLLPVLLMMMVAILDAGLVFAAQTAVSNASRVAALFAGSGGYVAWCRDPFDDSQKAPSPAKSVPCPTGATVANYATDRANMAYWVNLALGGLDPERVTIEPPMCGETVCTSPPGSGFVTVTVRYSLTLATPLAGTIWGDPVVISSTTTAKILE